VGANRPGAPYRSPYVGPPVGATWLDTRSIGPFVTAGTFVDGERVGIWESRAHRKHANRFEAGAGSTWWAPGAIGWWVGTLFMIGSACFALGSAPGYASAVGVSADNTTFFVGSLFFTTAAALQYLETVNADPIAGERRLHRRLRLLTWEPRRIDWWACSVQLVGTLWFNVSTFAALLDGLTAEQATRLVWRPDAYGSVCFLVASGLAWLEVGHAWLSWQPASVSWWIAGLNLVGSVAFGVSAVAAWVVPDSGQPVNAELVNLGTFVGALCFLVGGLLLLPERTRPSPPVPVPEH
jgi:hypothetical protein